MPLFLPGTAREGERCLAAHRLRAHAGVDGSVAFSGFSESAIRFLAELSRNNDRTWFEAHREECDRVLIEPAKELTAA
jgi:hypothetical protein